MDKVKESIKKFKNWIVRKLGGFTWEDASVVAQEAGFKIYTQLLEPWEKAVQEICRRSDNSYYDWCCEYCGMECDKRNGWCKNFAAIDKEK